MKKPKRHRNRTAEQYQVDILARQSELRVQCEKLDRLRRQMQAIQEDFRATRRAILDAETRHRHRPVQSGLTLELTVSEVTRAPRAVWKHYVRLKRNRKSGPPHITRAIPKRRKFEWTPKELGPYANYSEIFLVCETEAKLAVLRRKVWPLSKAAQKNAIAVTQLSNQLWERFGVVPAPVPTMQRPVVPEVPNREVPPWARGPGPDEETMVPQFKRPEGVL